MNLQTLTAADLMCRDVALIAPSETLRTAVQRMHHHEVRSLVVERAAPNQGFGIVTVRDVIGVIHDDDVGETLDQMTVADVATRPAIHVAPELGITDCINLMRTTGVRRLPVIADSEVVGVLSYSDVFRAIAVAVSLPNPVS